MTYFLLDFTMSSKKVSAQEKKLVLVLKAAQQAYYETAEPVMSDAEYDVKVEELRQLNPKSEFFNTPGPTPVKGKETLPVPMASLKKIKPESLDSWKSKGPYVISEKLDGISALWCTGEKKLYLRGDGFTGQNVSGAVPYIKGLQSKLGHWIVRGELIVEKSAFTDTMARNWVNGQLHQDTPNPDDLRKIRFVAYQVLQPSGLTRSQQFSWLKNNGFETAWNMTIATINNENLSAAFKERRENSIYTCDGIVVGMDTVPEPPAVAEPADAVAYKEIAADQCAMTEVLEVEWLPSKTGSLIPRLKLQPVKVGSATIQYCTGFNAQYIQENQLGPKAQIQIRRSGDVIPIVDKVLKPCPTGPSMPTASWKWDSTNTHALLTDPNSNPVVAAKNLVSSCEVFGVERFRDASAQSLVDEGIRSVADCLKAGMPKIQKILGSKIGSNFWTQLQNGVRAATEPQWLAAAPVWSKGVSAKKLEAIHSVEPTVAKWSSLSKTVPGISAKGVKEIAEAVPAYIAWKKEVTAALSAGV